MDECQGAFRGILLGVKDRGLEVEDTKVGEFYISMVLRNKVSNFRWELITVYGPANHEKTPDFIAELSRKCLLATLPMVLGGDINLIRLANEKNNGNINQGLMDRFNMFIDLHQLQELRRSGPRFTWTNKQKNLVMETLDRILVSKEWEARFPLCFAWSNTIVGLDHCPLFLDTGENSHQRQNHFFFFEKHWLMEEGFQEMMGRVWN
jgi:exonuclease III